MFSFFRYELSLLFLLFILYAFQIGIISTNAQSFDPIDITDINRTQKVVGKSPKQTTKYKYLLDYNFLKHLFQINDEELTVF